MNGIHVLNAECAALNV